MGAAAAVLMTDWVYQEVDVQCLKTDWTEDCSGGFGDSDGA